MQVVVQEPVTEGAEDVEEAIIYSAGQWNIEGCPNDIKWYQMVSNQYARQMVAGIISSIQTYKTIGYKAWDIRKHIEI